MMRCITLVILFIVCQYRPACAQVLPDSLILDEVTVTVSRHKEVAGSVGGGISTLERAQLQRNTTTALSEVLQSIPGVSVDNRFNYSLGERIQIRGQGSRAQFGVRGIKVLLDGIPLTFPDGTTQLNNLDLGYIGRVEVLRGPASTLYGNASGGVMLWHTEPVTDHLLLRGRVTFGSYGLRKIQLTGGGSFSQGKGNFLVSGSRLQSDGYREFSEARIYHINSICHWQTDSNTRLTVIFNGTSSPYLFNPSSLSREDADNQPQSVRSFVKTQVASKAIDQGQAGIKIERQLKSGHELTSTLYGVRRVLFNPIPGAIIDLSRLSYGWRTTYAAILAEGLHHVTGFDTEWQRDRRKEYGNPGVSVAELDQVKPEHRTKLLQKGPKLLDQKEGIWAMGLFTMLYYQPIDKVRLHAGLRYDRYQFDFENDISTTFGHQLTFSQASPMAGVVWQPAVRWSSYLTYATAYQTPTAAEFSNARDGTAVNRSLRPERLQSIEAGLNRQGHSLSLQLSSFYYHIKDQLIAYQNADELTYYENAGAAENRGVELSAIWRPHTTTTIRLAHTLMDYTFVNYDVVIDGEQFQLAGLQVPGAPRQQLYCGITYKPSSSLVLQVDQQYVSSYFANNFNGPLPGSSSAIHNYKNESYWTTSVQISYKKVFQQWHGAIFGGVNNLFDKQYISSITPNAFGDRYFEPAAGRNFYLGLQLGVNRE